jgi:diguanylate cyclase (GGDEF)-like protein
MRTITLKSRLIILLTTFTIVNIAIFIAIQLGYESKRVNKFSQSKAIVVVTTLEDTWNLLNTWEKVINFSLPLEKKLDFLKNKIEALKEAQEISQGYLLNREAQIIFSTDKFLENTKGDFYDLRIIDNLSNTKTVEREIRIDETKKNFFVYLPLVLGDNIAYVARLSFSLRDIWDTSRQVYQPAIAAGLLFIIVNIILGIFFSRLVIGPIKVFNAASKDIATGRLDLRINMPTRDELEEMANTFNFMAQELIKMKERAENANPLTKLPGNIMIMEEVEKRLKEQRKFTVIYSDLDNFKAFNDKYGIHQGDEAIKLAAQIFREAVKKSGGANDFVGHEGGDDFILLTTPEYAENIANYIIIEFDKRIRALYSQEDLERGYIVATARDGAIKQFPIMTISLAGVSNMARQINSYAEVTNIAAEVKKKAKKEQRSCFIMDKRLAQA